MDWVVHTGTTNMSGSIANQQYVIGRVRNRTGTTIAANKLNISWSVKGLSGVALEA